MGGRFSLGQLVFTIGVNDRVAEDAEFAKFVIASLRRHANCDWGDLCAEDMRENELSLKEGFRLFSAYKNGEQEKLWIITEADRSATTALFPDEY